MSVKLLKLAKAGVKNWAWSFLKKYKLKISDTKNRNFEVQSVLAGWTKSTKWAQRVLTFEKLKHERPRRVWAKGVKSCTRRADSQRQHDDACKLVCCEQFVATWNVARIVLTLRDSKLDAVSERAHCIAHEKIWDKQLEMKWDAAPEAIGLRATDTSTREKHKISTLEESHANTERARKVTFYAREHKTNPERPREARDKKIKPVRARLDNT